MEKTRDKLLKESKSLDTLKELLHKSNVITKDMVNILSNFGDKLTKLEVTIGPLYRDTENLRRNQENIAKALQSLEFIIPFYSLASELEPLISAGPDSMPLKEYLVNVDKLRRAVRYFEKNNPESPELMNVSSLAEKGYNSLINKFRLFLSNHSHPYSAALIYDLVNYEDNPDIPKPTIPQIPEKDAIQMCILSEWLSKNMRDKFISTYAQIRSDVIETSLRELKTHQKSSTGSSPMVARKSLTPIRDNSQPKRNPKSIQQALKKKLHDVMPHEMLGSRSYHSVPNDLCDLATNEKEIEYYLTSVTALYKLAQEELKFMDGIVPNEYQKILFSRLVLPALIFIVNEGESIASRAKKCTSRHDFTSALNLFPILRHQASMRHNFDLLFDGCSTEVQTKFQGLVVTLQTTLSKSLEEFIEYIRNDIAMKVSKDGTVHELTSNVMMFLVQLSNYLDILSRVITVTDVKSYERSADKNKLAFAQFISRVLSTLMVNLDLKSESYSDPYLKAIFKLNNIHYVLKTLRKSSLLEIVRMYSDNIEAVYENQILENKRVYSQSWTRVLHYLLELDKKPPVDVNDLANMKLKDKDRHLIKDRFAGFNKEIEDLQKVQKSYAVPDPELRETIKRDNANFIVPKYDQFYIKYSSMNFTKNVEKYVKYTPQEVYQIIQSFFDAAA